jgi:hypothetical protein
MIEISGWKKRLQHKMYGRTNDDDDDHGVWCEQVK